MSREVHVAIAGSTGAVGQEMLQVLEKRNFPVKKLSLLASARSAGKKQKFRGKEYTIQELTEKSFEGVDIALFSAGGKVTKQFAKHVLKAGAVLVDNSSAYRMDPKTPLVVPEINPEDIKKHKGIIANPNCSTIIMLMAVYPIHRLLPVKKIVVSTYQAASGAGAVAMQELKEQALQVLSGKEAQPKVFPYPVAFNAFSHNSGLDLESGYNEEEIKMLRETHKILSDESIRITATCVRIPTFRAHAESIHLELSGRADLSAIRKAWQDFPGVQVLDDREKNYFPMPIEATGKDEVFVGRLRHSLSSKERDEIDLFCCGDQILKGAALNAVQIAEHLL